MAHLPLDEQLKRLRSAGYTLINRDKPVKPKYVVYKPGTNIKQISPENVLVGRDDYYEAISTAYAFACRFGGPEFWLK